MSGSNSISTAQITCIMAMLNKLKLKPQKEDIIMGASNGRTTSTRELTSNEAIDLIKYLKSQDPDEQAAEKMRRKIISMAHEMGWKLPGGSISMTRVNYWCNRYGYLHKGLNDYSYSELPKLVSQFENVHSSFIRNL